MSTAMMHSGCMTSRDGDVYADIWEAKMKEEQG